MSNTRACNHSLNSSTLRELLCELQYLHAGTLFARPRPPWARGWRWSAVNTSRFLTSVSASSRRYSCAPQYQHSPPVFAQTYCRLVLGGFNVPSRVRGAPISLKIIVSQRQPQIRSFRLKLQQPKTPDAILVSVARSGLAWFRASTMSLSGAEAVRAIYDAEFRRDRKCVTRLRRICTIAGPWLLEVDHGREELRGLKRRGRGEDDDFGDSY